MALINSFSHRGVDATVKVNGDVELVAHRLAQAGDALDCGVDFAQMIYHLKFFCKVHLGGAKTVANGLLCRLHNVSRTIAANPSVDFDSGHGLVRLTVDERAHCGICL